MTGGARNPSQNVSAEEKGAATAEMALDLDDTTVLALAAREGDREALEELCRRLQGPMYRLCLRFTGHPADAEDAAQEVLVRIVTHLSSFEGRARFTTGPTRSRSGS